MTRRGTICSGIISTSKQAHAECDRCGRMWVHPENEGGLLPLNWRDR